MQSDRGRPAIIRAHESPRVEGRVNEGRTGAGSAAVAGASTWVATNTAVGLGFDSSRRSLTKATWFAHSGERDTAIYRPNVTPVPGIILVHRSRECNNELKLSRRRHVHTDPFTHRAAPLSPSKGCDALTLQLNSSVTSLECEV